MSSIWSSSTPTLQDTSDQSSKIMDNNISAVVNVDPLSHSLQSSKSADSIEKAQPESRWKKDSVWRNIESPLVPFNLTDEEELSIGSAAYLTADSCFTDDSVEPLVKETSINSTCAQRKLSAAPSTRRFGFVPSMALSKSCNKIAKDDDGKNSITQNVEGHDVQNNLTPPNAVGVHKPSRKSDDQVQALFGVSEMLTILKDYVLKSRYFNF